MSETSIVREELAESLVAFEFPAKFLKLRAEDLLDELAMLQGKIGEVEATTAEFESSIAEPGSAEHQSPQSLKVFKARKQTIECLQGDVDTDGLSLQPLHHFFDMQHREKLRCVLRPCM